MTINIINGKAHLDTPYNPEFVTRMKAIGARWDAASRTWTVKENMLNEAREIMRAVYGHDDTQDDVATADIRIRFNEAITEYRAGIILYGKTLAKAWGRDSGARVGEDVAFITGTPDSGGSMKNWTTIIPAGCVAVIKNVPLALMGSDLPSGAEIITDDDSKREALLARKAELEAALADLEAQLAAI